MPKGPDIGKKGFETTDRENYVNQILSIIKRLKIKINDETIKFSKEDLNKIKKKFNWYSNNCF